MATEIDFKKRIPQNSRTIIFETFNDKAKNLCTLLKGQDPDDAIRKIEAELIVKSFDEFKEKFNPTVYEIFNIDETGVLQGIEYSIEEKPKSRPISLCNHEFYKAVHDIAIKKSSSNVNNNDINYNDLYEALDPEKIYTQARKRREDVNQFVENALEDKENGNPDGYKKWIRMAMKTFDDVKHEYEGSALRSLPLIYNDTQKFLEIKEKAKGNENVTIENKNGNVGLLGYDVYWNEDGELETREIKNDETPEVLALETKKEQVLQIAAEGWEKTVDSKELKGFVDRNMFLSVYAERENLTLAKLSTTELEERKELYGNMYVNTQQSFCKAVGYLVQKVASVEQFFIHAGDDKGIVESGVIIANCSIKDVIDNEEIVKDYLRIASNHEKDRIWFAILPAVSNDLWQQETVSDGNIMDDGIWGVFDEEPTDNGVEKVDISSINIISSMLSEYGILSFFNFVACEETSFKKFGENSKIFEDYSESVSSIEKTDSVVLAYPNFTIIPKNKRQVEMVNDRKLYTPSVYVDAAYVAAGLVVATQTEKIQKKRFGKQVKDGNPFMRFDLEDENFGKKFVTKFNPESRINMDRELSILLRGKDGNAFCFKSDSQEPHATVFTARTLKCKPLYQFLTQKYLMFLLERENTSGLNTEKAQKFNRAISNIYSNENNPDIVNPILRSGEEFNFSAETGKFSLKFKGMNEPIECDIEIEE